MAQKKKQNKQGKQSQRIETNSCQDSPCLAEGRRERRKDVHGRSSSKVQGTSTLESTPPGSETSTLSLHNPLLPFRTSDPSVQLISQEMYSHTRTGPRAYFRFRDTRNACTMRCVATPRADWSRRFPFWIHGITGRRGSSDGPHPAALPLPPSAVYPYWRELEATWCAIVDRSTLATFQGCEYISTWNCCRGYFLRMPWELLLFFFFLFGVTFRC